MSVKKRYYFDTNALYKHYVFDKPDTVIHALSDNHTVYISNLTYLEMLSVLMHYLRSKKISKEGVESVLEQLQKDIGTTERHRFQLVPTQEGVFQYARTLMIDYANELALGTNDALHIAMAKMLTPPVMMVTSDGGKGSGKMKGVCAKVDLEVFDPEQAEI